MRRRTSGAKDAGGSWCTRGTRGRRVDIIFAVYLQNRWPAIRAAVLDADTEEVLNRAGIRESAAI